MTRQRSIARTSIIIMMLLICGSVALQAQESVWSKPVWWVGEAAAANLNFYGGTVQNLNTDMTTPLPFTGGFGGGFYFAFLGEYRPDPVWGAMLHVAYDDRQGKFNDVWLSDPCNCNTTLTADIAYLSLEPSLRITPFGSGLYLYAGPRIAFILNENTRNRYIYTEEGDPPVEVKGNMSDVRSTVYSAQIGAGYDFWLTSRTARDQITISPFLSYQPTFGQKPRTVETWALSTLRVGVAVKWGRGHAVPLPAAPMSVVPDAVERDATFAIRAPKAVPIQRRVRETFPILNYVFFDEGSIEIPARYVTLTKSEAADFTEAQLQEVQPKNNTGRSERQMLVYHNILNSLGDRMRNTPDATVDLIGASANGPQEGRAFAESIKRYLVDVFGIDAARITTRGQDKPRIPSAQIGGTHELPLLLAEDRRVDIESRSPELMMQVGGPPIPLNPVQINTVLEDPLDSHILFTVEEGSESLDSWSLDISDKEGTVQHYGPFTQDIESVPGRTVLGTRTEGDYAITMTGQLKGGGTVVKKGTVHLVRRDVPKALRFGILLGFDESKSIARYENFLTEKIAPLISEGSIVLIHGHTDIIGDDSHNMTLSKARAADAQSILERALSQKGTRGVTFETYGFGEDLHVAPFDNDLPEERCYNRTVIIDIIQD